MSTKLPISLCISNDIRRFDIKAFVFKGLKLQEAVMVKTFVSFPFFSIESTKNTSMENVGSGVLEKIKNI